MSDFLSKLARFFLDLRRSWLLATSRRNSVLRQIAGWGIPVVGLALACAFFWEDLWEHAERIRNLALVAAAAVGLPIAAWRSSTAHRQAETAQNSLLTERYQRAAEMLGGKKVVRMAGIHALIRMAQSELTHHVLIMRTLSDVVRTSAKRQDAPGREQKREDVPGREQTLEDVTVIVEALGARSPKQMLMEEWEEYKLNLCATDLRGLPVDKVMFPRAILDYAVFSDSENQAVFLDTDFQDASLVGTGLDAAFLSGVNLASAELTCASLTGARLIGADLQGATLSNADFSNAEFNKGVNIENAILEDTNLTNVTGLTQQQLNSAEIDPARPPILAGATDPDTGKPLAVPA